MDLPKIYSRELVELIFRQPYCKIPFLGDAGIARHQTASSYLQALEHAGYVTSEMVGRERVSMNLPLLEALKG